MLIPELKEQIEKVKKLHEKDFADDWGKVSMPQALDNKYLQACKELKCQLPHLPSFLCHTSIGKRLRYPKHPGAAWSQ